MRFLHMYRILSMNKHKDHKKQPTTKRKAQGCYMVSKGFCTQVETKVNSTCIYKVFRL